MNYIRALVFILVAAVVWLASNQFRYNESRIQAYLYRLTPLGTSYEESLRRISKKYEKFEKNETGGFWRQDLSPARTVGSKSIQVHVAEYFHFPIGKTCIVAYWGFDKDGRLIEIWIWKTTDSI